jgi:hypothetical protein
MRRGAPGVPRQDPEAYYPGLPAYIASIVDGGFGAML